MSASDYMLDRQGEQFDRALAEHVGITYDDLQSCSFHVSDQEGNDDMVYGYIVEFNTDETPAEILEKMSNLEGGDTVYLPLNFIQESDDDQDPDQD